MAEPVSLETARAHLRVLDTSEDDLIEVYIAAAREWVENYTGQILVQRPVTDHFGCFWRYLELTKRPIVEVTEVAYVDTDGADQTYADFLVTSGRYPTRVFPALNGWFPKAGVGGVSVTYLAGYDAGEVPVSLKQAILLLVGHWFANRETVNVGNIVSQVPFAVEALCDQYRSPLV